MTEGDTSILFLDITVHGDSIEENFSLLKLLRPLWNLKDIRRKKFAMGRINSMTSYFLSSDKCLEDALVVRVYSAALDNVGPADKGFAAMQVACAAGCFPPLLASFSNGVVYQYAHGRPVTFHELKDPVIIKEITNQLVQFHSVDLDSITLYNREGMRVGYDKTSSCIKRVEDLLASIPDRPKDKRKEKKYANFRKEFTNDVLRNELLFIKSAIEQVDMPCSILHNDLQHSNLIIDDQTGKITILDYETASFGYEYHDLAYFLRCKLISDMIGYTSADDEDFSEEICHMYIERYSAKYDISSEISKEVTLIQHDIMDCFELYWNIVVSLALMDLETVDMMKLIDRSVNEYWTRKAEIPVLLKRYTEIATHEVE